jgi:hypothetical protein
LPGEDDARHVFQAARNGVAYFVRRAGTQAGCWRARALVPRAPDRRPLVAQRQKPRVGVVSRSATARSRQTVAIARRRY